MGSNGDRPTHLHILELNDRRCCLTFFWRPAGTLEEKSMCFNHSLIRMALVVTVLFCTSDPASAQVSLDAMLAPVLTRYELPALAAAVVKDG